MTVLEEVTQMRNQGMPENEIVNSLQERGFSPRDINDALGQSKIKSAVSYGADNMSLPMPQSSSAPLNQGPQTMETDYSPSQDLYNPQPQEYAPQPSQEYYPQEAYANYAQAGGGTDTIIEIAEQVFSQKTQKIQKQLEELNEFKTLAQTKIDLLAERLKRIETIIDKLEISILDKVGSYGSNLQSIKKEMSMMQDSFSKVVNKAVKGHHSTTPHKTKSTAHRKKTSKKK